MKSNVFVYSVLVAVLAGLGLTTSSMSSKSDLNLSNEHEQHEQEANYHLSDLLLREDYWVQERNYHDELIYSIHSLVNCDQYSKGGKYENRFVELSCRSPN